MAWEQTSPCDKGTRPLEMALWAFEDTGGQEETAASTATEFWVVPISRYGSLQGKNEFFFIKNKAQTKPWNWIRLSLDVILSKILTARRRSLSFRTDGTSARSRMLPVPQHGRARFSFLLELSTWVLLVSLCDHVCARLRRTKDRKESITQRSAIAGDPIPPPSRGLYVPI